MRECVTNTVRHAGGSEMAVSIRRAGRGVSVTLTNNGAPPAGPVTEGGGLSSLRRRIERAGGAMSLRCQGAFAVCITLPEGELP